MALSGMALTRPSLQFLYLCWGALASYVRVDFFYSARRILGEWHGNFSSSRHSVLSKLSAPALDYLRNQGHSYAYQTATLAGEPFDN
jgi:hypothetical protein